MKFLRFTGVGVLIGAMISMLILSAIDPHAWRSNLTASVVGAVGALVLDGILRWYIGKIPPKRL